MDQNRARGIAVDLCCLNLINQPLIPEASRLLANSSFTNSHHGKEHSQSEDWECSFPWRRSGRSCTLPSTAGMDTTITNCISRPAGNGCFRVCGPSTPGDMDRSAAGEIFWQFVAGTQILSGPGPDHFDFPHGAFGAPPRGEDSLPNFTSI